MRVQDAITQLQEALMNWHSTSVLRHGVSFLDMLTYKSAWYGNDVVKVPTMYPSSQTCSSCGYKNPLVKNLAVRVWECPDCHTVHDRDGNASINILNKGLQMQSA